MLIMSLLVFPQKLLLKIIVFIFLHFETFSYIYIIDLAPILNSIVNKYLDKNLQKVIKLALKLLFLVLETYPKLS